MNFLTLHVSDVKRATLVNWHTFLELLPLDRKLVTWLNVRSYASQTVFCKVYVACMHALPTFDGLY
jgi:hypothetical protein